jgi:hypothetical protein
MTTIQIKLAEFFLALLLLTGCYFWVRHDAVADYKKEVAVEQAKADKIQQAKYDNLAADYAILKASRTVQFKTITKTVEKLVKQPSYQVPCITQEGVDAANKALEGAHE